VSRRSIYIITEENNETYCKIGKDSNWPFRFKQAQSHNPVSLGMAAVWHFEGISLKQINELESVAQAGLSKVNGSIVAEWYAITPKDAVDTLSKRFGRAPDEVDTLPKVGLYDDWRERDDTKKGVTYKRRIWVNSEEGEGGRVKISYSIFYDTYYQYKFTYNPRPVYLNCCFEYPVSFGGPSPSLKKGNEVVNNLWDEAIKSLGNGLQDKAVGWLRPGVTISDVASFFLDRGLVIFDITAPKPDDCLPWDPQIPKLQAGKAPPNGRLRPFRGDLKS
jgi:hypothetical protein